MAISGQRRLSMGEVTDEVLARFGALPTSTICDAMIKAGERAVERMVIAGVQPVLPRTVRVAGRARTERRTVVRDRSRMAMATRPDLKGGASDRAEAGDFIVVTGPEA